MDIHEADKKPRNEPYLRKLEQWLHSVGSIVMTDVKLLRTWVAQASKLIHRTEQPDPSFMEQKWMEQDDELWGLKEEHAVLKMTLIAERKRFREKLQGLEDACREWKTAHLRCAVPGTAERREWCAR